MSWLVERYSDLERFWQHEIWQPLATEDRRLRGHLRGVMRVVSVTITGLLKNNITTRAAALSYASLLGLGPLVVIAVLVAGFVLNQQDPAVAMNTLTRAIQFIAPQVTEYEHVDRKPAAHAARLAPVAAGRTVLGVRLCQSKARGAPSRSMVEMSAPRWKLTVARPKCSPKTAESRCCPLCCCM